MTTTRAQLWELKWCKKVRIDYRQILSAHRLEMIDCYNGAHVCVLIRFLVLVIIGFLRFLASVIGFFVLVGFLVHLARLINRYKVARIGYFFFCSRLVRLFNVLPPARHDNNLHDNKRTTRLHTLRGVAVGRDHSDNHFWASTNPK